jgi:tetratricopeptide (TPR) repeat protein
MPNKRKRRSFWTVLNSVFLLLTGVAVGVLISTWVIPTFAQRYENPKPPAEAKNTPQTSAPPAADLIRWFEDGEQRLFAHEKDRLNALDSNSRVLMTLAGVFALFLGLGAWKTLEDQRRSAAENLDLQMTTFSRRFEQAIEEHRHQSETTMLDLRAMRDEIHRDFPMFGRMRQNFTRMLTQLQVACQGLEATDETYDMLTWDQRESILFLEHAVADSMLLDTKDLSVQLSEIYRLLGLFYGSKYYGCRTKSKDASLRADLDRARFYFDRAIELDPKNYFAYSHAGYFTLYFDDPGLAAQSREYLKQATVIGSTKQRPLVNLALLALNSFSDPDESLKCIEAALQRSEWEKSRSKPKNQHCYYVRACALAAKAVKAPDAAAKREMLASTLEQLENAALGVDDWIRGCFEGDTQTAVDRTSTFYEIEADPALATRFLKVCSAVAT